MSNNILLYSMPTLEEKNINIIQDTLRERSGCAFFGRDITEKLKEHFNIDDFYLGNRIDEAIQLIGNPMAKDKIISVELIKQEDRTKYLETTRQSHGSELFCLNSFFYLSFWIREMQQSHLPWKPYYVQPAPQAGEICGNWLERELRNRLDEEALSEIDAKPDLVDISEHILKSMEESSQEVWELFRLTRLKKLVNEANESGMCRSYQVNDLLLKLRNFLPPHKTTPIYPCGHLQIKEGLSSLRKIRDDKIPDLNVILLLEGYLALNREPASPGRAGRLWAFMAHPLLAYQIAKHVYFPRRLPNVSSLQDFASHYDLKIYKFFQENNRKRFHESPSEGAL